MKIYEKKIQFFDYHWMQSLMYQLEMKYMQRNISNIKKCITSYLVAYDVKFEAQIY